MERENSENTLYDTTVKGYAITPEPKPTEYVTPQIKTKSSVGSGPQ